MVLFRAPVAVAAVAALLVATAFVAGSRCATDLRPPHRVRDRRRGRPRAAGRRTVRDPSVPSTPDPTPTGTAQPASVDTPLPLEPGIRLLGPGDRGPKVRDLQARLRQIDWFQADVTGDVRRPHGVAPCAASRTSAASRSPARSTGARWTGSTR